jgi:hypothetical protein
MICKYCGEERLAEAFEVCRIVKGKVYRRRRCQMCKREVTNRRILRLRAWLDDYKQSVSCLQCGFRDYRALQFHHTEGDKEANIADMVRAGMSVEALRREIEKCIVLCANCHSIEHYEAFEQRRRAGATLNTGTPRNDP